MSMENQIYIAEVIVFCLEIGNSFSPDKIGVPQSNI